MKNTFGNAITLTLFGESHAELVGATVDGLAPGMEINDEYIASVMKKRSAELLSSISTQRKEKDEVRFVSGVYNGKTTGTPLTVIIENKSNDPGDYINLIYRPSHADYTAHIKYNGFEDFRGGGHFSGRLTAPITAIGAVLSYALNKKGIYAGTHINYLHGISDAEFGNYRKDIEYLENADFPTLSSAAKAEMMKTILCAKENGDSVGGILETAIIGIDAGVGEPFFDSVESMLSHAVFSVPGVKGVEFGKGFALADMYGSQANDPFYNENGKILTKTNNSGGVNGGITNGMPIIMRCVVKPTSSIAKEQSTVDPLTNENVQIIIKGRHDPTIVHRASAVINALTYITLADLSTQKYGADYLSD